MAQRCVQWGAERQIAARRVRRELQEEKTRAVQGSKKHKELLLSPIFTRNTFWQYLSGSPDKSTLFPHAQSSFQCRLMAIPKCAFSFYL
jgi:hypothetical protein